MIRRFRRHPEPNNADQTYPLTPTHDTPCNSLPGEASRRRFRFSILQLFATVFLICLLCSHAITSCQFYRMRKENEAIRKQAYDLAFQDPQRLHVKMVPSQADWLWRWRIYVPTHKQYRLAAAWSAVPTIDIPVPEVSKGPLPSGDVTLKCSVRLLPDDHGEIRFDIHDEEFATLHDQLSPNTPNSLRVAVNNPTQLALLRTRLAVYRCPSSTGRLLNPHRRLDPAGANVEVATSNYVGSMGVSSRAPAGGVIFGNSAIGLRDILDGTSATFLAGERAMGNVAKTGQHGASIWAGATDSTNCGGSLPTDCTITLHGPTRNQMQTGLELEVLLAERRWPLHPIATDEYRGYAIAFGAEQGRYRASGVDDRAGLAGCGSARRSRGGDVGAIPRKQPTSVTSPCGPETQVLVSARFLTAKRLFLTPSA